ncbi:hypothetical protein FN846DRAFT_886022 [Sphaerosporella brunnea]|uniref:Uncharacterized protein n=1 Tax=Sphaerosporella brunnea TaxID=1250544 RepID=A0A5J5FAX8_9PEZI|nr:hypothetical protein FN846DRAFT_886022 [Sphaerosporella brunnea]
MNVVQGWVRSEMKRAVWMPTSEMTNAGQWQYLTRTEIQELEKEEKEKTRKRGQEAPVPRKKTKTKRAKTMAENSDPIQHADDDAHDERVPVHAFPNQDRVNTVNTESMHPDGVKKCARKLCFKGEARPDIITCKNPV